MNQTTPTKAPKIAIIAGETSGDQLGGWLMAALKEKRPDIQFIGVGGRTMQAQGLSSLFNIQDIALIGIAEILPHVRTLTRRIKQTVRFLEREKPDIILTIDVPGFSLRVLKRLRARNKIHSKLVHYVAPTVWAYRPERAKIVAERYDHLLCLLPFEPPYFEAEGLKTTYIGHEIAWWWKSGGNGMTFRQQHNIPVQVPLLAVFPGSRRGELDRLLPIFKAAVALVKKEVPNLEVVMQVPPDHLERVKEETASWRIPCEVLTNVQDKKGLFAAATVALAKSGTIALECALAGVPSVIAYKASPLSAYLLKRMIKVPYVSIANLLLNKPAVPELLQENCTPEKIAHELTELLLKEPNRVAQRNSLVRVSTMLGAAERTSPSQKAADILLGML